jgi:hypothetical protein
MYISKFYQHERHIDIGFKFLRKIYSSGDYERWHVVWYNLFGLSVPLALHEQKNFKISRESIKLIRKVPMDGKINVCRRKTEG